MEAATTPAPADVTAPQQEPENQHCYIFFAGSRAIPVKGGIDAVAAYLAAQDDVFVKLDSPEGHQIAVRPNLVVSIRDQV